MHSPDPHEEKQKQKPDWEPPDEVLDVKAVIEIIRKRRRPAVRKKRSAWHVEGDEDVRPPHPFDEP
jgi:hypothetical protein